MASGTLKFSRTATPQPKITVPDNANLTIPNSDWTVGAVVVLDGTVSAGYDQYAIAMGTYATTGTLDLCYTPSGVGAQWFVYLNNGGSRVAYGGMVQPPGTAYLIAVRRIGTTVKTVMCPVLSSAPTDSSAVILNPSSVGTGASSLNVSLDCVNGILFGDSWAGGRRFDHSMGRAFRVDRALTDFEIAQLAYGKEITDLPTPTTPAWYFRMSSPTDLTDSGSFANPSTNAGVWIQGTDPGFGYVSTPLPPSVDSIPVIVGSPQVSVATSYTPSTTSGTPNPVTTQQWTIDGVDIPGATGATYIPVTSDTNKLLRVRQIASNVNGTASATSQGVMVANTTVSIDMNEQQADRIYQRINGSANLALTGTYSGTTPPATIEFQLYAPDGTTIVQPWTNANATIPAGGTWSASPLVSPPANGKKFRIAVRSKDSGGNLLSSSAVKNSKVGVGEIIFGIGSSSAATWFGSGSGAGYTPDNDITSTMNGSSWTVFTGTGIVTLMSIYFAQRFNCPVAMIGYGISGDTLNNWVNTNSSSWTSFQAGVGYAGGKIGAVFSSMGSNDATNASMVTSRAGQLAKLRSVIQATRTLTNQPNLPFLWSGFNRRLDGINPQSDYVRMSENDIGDDPNVYHVQTLDFELGGDGVHLTGAGFIACAARMQRVYADAVTGVGYRRGPKIVGLAYDGTDVIATLQHRGSTDFTPLNNITGFTVTDASGTPNILSVVHSDASHVRITTDRPLVAPVVAQYLAGNAPPVGTPVFDNGAMSLPMHVETDLATTSLLVIKSLAGALVESQSQASDMKRARGIAATMAASETQSGKVSRTRGGSASQTQVEGMTGVLGRLRKIVSSLVEAEVITATFFQSSGAIKLFAGTMALLEGIGGSINRARNFASLTSQTENVSASIKRARSFASSSTQAESITGTVNRSRNFSGLVGETGSMAGLLGRARKFVSIVSGAESINGVLGRNRGLTASLTEVSSITVASSNVKLMSAVFAEVQTINQARVSRSRTIQTTVVESESISAKLGRLRSVIGQMIEAETNQAVVLGRIRSAITHLVEVEGFKVNLTILDKNPTSFDVTATFERWVVLPNGTFDLQTEVLTWLVTSKK